MTITRVPRGRARRAGARPIDGWRSFARLAVTVAAALVAAASCTTPPPVAEPGSSAAGTTPVTAAAASSSETAQAVLSVLHIDDHPHAEGYRRDEWPLWKDTDHDGCDARDQALIAASTTPVQRSGCKVLGGTWVSPYDGVSFTDPSKLDIDHVVPLENAYQSGGWQWSTDRRAEYANDQASLWVVSASANRSKGAKGPDAWRPPVHELWCEYATRWVAIKFRWDLSATTAERDALGQMLDTCTTAPAVPTTAAAPASVVDPPTTAAVPSSVAATPSTAVFYKNCTAARAAGAAPLHRGDPGYRPEMDGDHDGIACE